MTEIAAFVCRRIYIMRVLKAFAVTYLICSLLLCFANGFFSSWQTESPWIVADSDEVTVSVKNTRNAWKKGVTAGVGESESLTDQVRLTHIGKMNDENCLNVIYTVTDDLGRTVSLTRTIRFSDYTPPNFMLLRIPEFERGTSVNLANLILVTDPLDGNITDSVQVVSSNLNTARAGTYEMMLTVENSYGVRADYLLTVTVI